MAFSRYASTPETTNVTRACRVVLGPCTDGLRDILRHYVPPQTFSHVINEKKHNVPQLLTFSPQNGSYSGNYDDMDIPLLYILLRDIAGISPHSKGWGNNPKSRDNSVSANIERIRLIRNRCIHSSDPFLSNSDFNSVWCNIRSVMVDLDTFLNNGNKYERDVDFLRYESLDPEHDLHFIDELRSNKMFVNLNSESMFCIHSALGKEINVISVLYINTPLENG